MEGTGGRVFLTSTDHVTYAHTHTGTKTHNCSKGFWETKGAKEMEQKGGPRGVSVGEVTFMEDTEKAEEVCEAQPGDESSG